MEEVMLWVEEVEKLWLKVILPQICLDRQPRIDLECIIRQGKN